ncbi:Uncharacterized protein TCM_021962 isoform 3 [Theobroma cacao]|uniref:Uncharacterized protein isoform 3 n=1 Tax=Theobroma cacao TaxID=3641 RepID=A0A061ESA6_THECC|nr:Uncharacterized protein TCM_021962 isoform 3 [Theobroma cacao]
MEAVTVSDNSVELEAKRKEDSSWHPCRVYLSSSGDSLIVNFGRQELDDMLLQKEEVLMHLRFRSMPLQVDDCFHIEEGERVLADRKSQFKILFHDAVVVKVDRVRHSKRGCRCTFMIKWLDQDLEGQTFTLPSSSIMKLATKSISAHPIINKLLKPEKHRGLSYSSPLLTILEGTDSEIDLNKLLQKQIEQISNLADASKKDIPEDIPWRNKGVNKGQSPHKPTAESNACVPAVADHHNHLKRTTRSTRKLQINIEAENQSGHTISMKEAFIQSRSHLSPLASRAALASSLLTAKKCLDMDLSSSMTASMFMKGKDSSDILAVSIPLVSEASHEISPHISTQGDASCEPKSTTSEKMKAALTPCKDMDSGRSNQGQKRKAVHHIKQDRRFSPRNFLPRTRSRNKAQPGK